MLLLPYLLCAALTAESGEPALRWQAKLDSHTAVGLRLTGKTDHGHPMSGLIVVRKNKQGVWTDAWTQPRLNPWKLLLADVDGDGKPDILVGVWKKSPYDRIMEKRVFVYTWNGTRLMPKWLGSRLTRRFDDYTVADVDGDGKAELLALERCPEGRRRVSEYRWLGFGFEWLACSAERKGLTNLESKGSASYAVGPGVRFRVVPLSGKLVLTKENK